MAREEGDRRAGGPLPEDLRQAAERGDLACLIEALSAPDFKVREAAAAGLGEVGGDKAEFALMTVARDRWNERPEVRVAALRALGSAQGRDAYLRTLSDFICGDNRKVMTAARKLLEGADPNGFPATLAASGAVDYPAIRVYGATAEPSAVGLLADFLLELERVGSLTSPVCWGKVHAVVRALGNIGGAESVKTLEALGPALERAEAASSGLGRERIKKLLAAVEAAGARKEGKSP